jgi:hypothetical protein
MTSQTTGAAPDTCPAWPRHVGDATAHHDCAPLLSLAGGAADVRLRRAPAGGCGRSVRATGGPCPSTAPTVAPRPEFDALIAIS